MQHTDLTIQSRAHEAGYIQPLTIHTPCETIHAWANPDADWDSVFAVIDAETGERLRITGWNVHISRGHV